MILYTVSCSKYSILIEDMGIYFAILPILQFNQTLNVEINNPRIKVTHTEIRMGIRDLSFSLVRT